MTRAVGAASMLAGCLGAPLVDVDDGADDTSASDDSTTTSTSPSTGATQSSATGAMTTFDPGGSTSTGVDPSDPTTGCGFICDDDTDGPAYECDIWEQDCPPDQKCMPWADGGNTWNATKCTPLDDTPAGVGDACTVVDSAVSGIDDCERAAMCWNVDPETNMGECVAFCTGSEANPVCEDAGSQCTITSEGPLILCHPRCDPLEQDCGDGEACYPLHDWFLCGLDHSGDAGAYGDPCEYIDVCNPGLFCANVDAVPDCAGGSGCCSDYCDITSDDPDAMCTGAAQGQACVPWYERGQAPPGAADIGACMIPL